jgi:hypothetical protein
MIINTTRFRISLIAALLLLAGAGTACWILAAKYAPNGEPSAAAESEPPPSEPEVLVLKTEGPEVFRRAFWRRPSEEDVILGAERREWSDSKGVTRWQWFLEVEPSAELQSYLLEENAFQLAAAPDGIDLRKAERPDWFPGRLPDFEAYQSPSGDMTVFFDPESNHLYATSAGGGFVRATASPPAPEPVVETASSGRLPNTPPPTTRQP